MGYKLYKVYKDNKMFNLEHVIVDNNKRQIINSENQHNVRYNIPDWIIIKYNTYCNNHMLYLRDCPKIFKSITLHYKCNHLFLFSNYIILIFQIRISYSQIAYICSQNTLIIELTMNQLLTHLF